MFKQQLFILACLITVCLMGMAVTVEAQVTCNGASRLSLYNGSDGDRLTTSAPVCYQVRDISLSAIKFSLSVSVTSGSVDVYWAQGETSNLSRRINARKDLRGTNRFSPAMSDTGLYTLAIVPAGESQFSFLLKALEPAPQAVAAASACTDDVCSAQQPLDEVDPLLEEFPGSSVSIPIDAECPSHIEIDVSWSNGSLLELRLENQDSIVTSYQSSAPFRFTYDPDKAVRRSGSVWQWTLVNVNGGAVKGLTVIPYPPQTSCYDPFGAITDEIDIQVHIPGLIHEDPAPPVPTVPPQPVVVDLPTLVPMPTAVPLPTEVVCPGSQPPRLAIGGYARVTPGDPNRLRPEPARGDRQLGVIEAGEVFLVLEGPLCADNITWWRVQYNGMEGWTAESGDGSAYWVEPDETVIVCPESQPAHLLVGGYGLVTPGDPNSVRADPRPDINSIGKIPGGERFYVMDGPVCEGGYTWWKVEYNGLTGWTPESGDGSEYWLVPDN